MSELSDFFENSQYHMANIVKKQPTFRTAIAYGEIYVGEVGFHHIKHQTLPKGDVLKLAEIAGVQGAKSAATLIPMCHPLLLDHVAIYLELNEDKHQVEAYGIVSTTAKTGVEMEALAAINASLLTLYDLTKPVDPALTIQNIRLLLKKGGKKGLWMHPDGVPEKLKSFMPKENEAPFENVTFSTITLSDRASKGIYEDKSGKILQDKIKQLGGEIIHYHLIEDNKESLIQLLEQETSNVIITTGGTGIAKSDITIETLNEYADYKIDGIGEVLRAYAQNHVPTTWLSRSAAFVKDQQIIICLPGSSGGVKDGVEVLKPILSHAVSLLTKDGAHSC